ncbi:glycosyltransferase [Kitasatospora aburaviensis]
MADVNVVPSLWESFCYVCAEMMAFGHPVVASAVDSLRELIPGPEYGYPVPVSGPSGDRTLDPADLAAALRRALERPEEARLRGGPRSGGSPSTSPTSASPGASRRSANA